MRIAFLVLLVASTLAGQRAVDIFPVEAKCACIRTRKETSTVFPKELVSAGRVWQVFSNSRGQELFRFDIRFFDAKEGEVKFWNYGIVIERDLNADGRSDYSWYGGDDTSDRMILALSSAQGFKLVDVQKSASQAYALRFKTGPPNLVDLGQEFRFDAVFIEPSRNPVLEAVVHHYDYKSNKESTVTLTIPQRAFQYIRKR